MSWSACASTRPSFAWPSVSPPTSRRPSCSRMCSGSTAPAWSCCRSWPTVSSTTIAPRSSSRSGPKMLEGKEAVLTLLADLGRDSSVVRIELTPLSPEGTRRLVAAILGEHPATPWPTVSMPSATAIRCSPRSSWPPPSTAGARHAVPPKLRDVLAARLAQVPADVLAVLRVAAAAGRTIDDRLLVECQRPLDASRCSAPCGPRSTITSSFGAAGPTVLATASVTRCCARWSPPSCCPPRPSASMPPTRGPCPGTAARSQHATEIASHWDAAGETELAPGGPPGGRRRHAVDAFAFDQAQPPLRACAGAVGPGHRCCGADARDPPGCARLRRVIGGAGRRLRRAIDLTRRSSVSATPSTPRPTSWPAPACAGTSGNRVTSRLPSARPKPSPRTRPACPGIGAPMPWRTWRPCSCTCDVRPKPAARAREARDLAREVDAIEEQILAEGVLGWCLLLEGDVEAGLASIRRALDAARDHRGRPHGRPLPGRSGTRAYPARHRARTGGSLRREAHDVAVAGIAIAARQGVTRTFGSVLQASAARALYQLGRWDALLGPIDEALRAGAVGAGRIALLAVRGLLAVGRGDQSEAAASPCRCRAPRSMRRPRSTSDAGWPQRTPRMPSGRVIR